GVGAGPAVAVAPARGPAASRPFGSICQSPVWLPHGRPRRADPGTGLITAHGSESVREPRGGAASGACRKDRGNGRGPCAEVAHNRWRGPVTTRDTRWMPRLAQTAGLTDIQTEILSAVKSFVDKE